jgi:hypothetical protein
MPLTILHKRVNNRSAALTLDDGLAMSPTAHVLATGKMVVGMHIGQAGQAAPQARRLGNAECASKAGRSSTGAAASAADQVQRHTSHKVRPLGSQQEPQRSFRVDT